eukprot:g4300.t1
MMAAKNLLLPLCTLLKVAIVAAQCAMPAQLPNGYEGDANGPSGVACVGGGSLSPGTSCDIKLKPGYMETTGTLTTSFSCNSGSSIVYPTALADGCDTNYFEDSTGYNAPDYGGTIVYYGVCTACAAETTLAAALFTESVTTCECDAGRYINEDKNDECTLCPKGYYSIASSPNTTSCEVCPLGRYLDELGGEYFKYVSDGTRSVTDFYRRIACKECPTGKAGESTPLSEVFDCSDCPKGRYGPFSDMTSLDDCVLCAEGKYQPVVGQSLEFDCLLCPAGKYGNAMGLQEVGACPDCPIGLYGDVGGLQVCKNCPLGYYGTANGGTTSSAVCDGCPSGTYSDAQPVSSISGCKECPAGQYSDQTAAVSVVVYSGSQYYESGDSNSPVNGRVTCKACPLGYHGNGAAGGTSTGNCAECSQGRYGDIRALGANSDCEQCPAGRYGEQPAATSPCAACEEGKFLDTAGASTASACKNCPTGRYSDVQAVTASNNCKTCPKGKWSSSVGLVTSDACSLCPVGRYSDDRGLTASAACKQCPTGKYLDQEGRQAISNCKSCPTGRFGDSEGLTATSDCSPSDFANILVQISISEATCTDIQFVSSSVITCTIDFQGQPGTCSGKYVQVSVDRQASNSVEVCFIPNGLVVGIPAEDKRVDEANITKVVAINARAPDNNVDEGSGVDSLDCNIEHIFESDDLSYYNANALKQVGQFSITTRNNDVADTKLQIINADGTFSYRLKILGPIDMTEGTNSSFAVVLDTKARKDVNVNLFARIQVPRANTPLKIALYPKSLLFTSLTWNVPQKVILESQGDDIDNDQDVETFEVEYHAVTTDTIFQDTAVNNTVIVRVSDDDTASINLASNDILQATEGGNTVPFEVASLGSQPLHGVTVEITSSSHLLEIVPKTFSVPVTKWDALNQEVRVRATNGNYGGGTTFMLTLTSSSSDPKYAGISATKTVVVTTNDAQASVLGIPADDTVTEGGIRTYKLSLSTPPSLKNVDIRITSSNTMCTVSPLAVSFTTTSWNGEKSIVVETSDDGKHFAKDSITYSCNLEFLTTSSDAVYARVASPTLSLAVTSTGCVCSHLGLKAPHVAEGWWRHDPLSPDLNQFKFYSCPYSEACLGGNATTGRCRKGHNGPVCATCMDGYVMQTGKCIACPQHDVETSFNGLLLGFLALVFVSITIGSYFFLTAPALTKRDREEARATLQEMGPMPLFRGKNSIASSQFVDTVSRRRSSLSGPQIEQLFTSIVGGESETMTEKDFDNFIGTQEGKEEQGEDTVVEDESGSTAELAISMSKKAGEGAQEVWKTIADVLQRTDGIVEQIQNEIQLWLKTVTDTIETAWKNSKDDVANQLETVREKIQSRAERLRALLHAIEERNFTIWNCILAHAGDARQLLLHLLPEIMALQYDLRGSIDFLHHRISVIPKMLSSLDLPAMPNLQVDELWDTFDMALQRLPQIHIPEELPRRPKIVIGGILMKIKIFVGFAQCFSYFAVTFDVPWPPSVLAFMRAMELTALDIFALFGDLACSMSTNFAQKFVMHMAVVPATLLVHTEESSKTNVFTILTTAAFALYTGVATRIFRLFKCREVQGQWYLTEDYSLICFSSSEWTALAVLAAVCSVLYIVGIPLIQGIALFRNRKVLHREDCGDDVTLLQRQQKMEKEYGSVYKHYTKECYYYDLLDLFRRLLLTGGLIMVGEDSIVQTFLGIVVCCTWLYLVVRNQPYRAKLDNWMATILNSHLLLTLVCGMALKLYDATPEKDVYEQIGFTILIITVT